MQIRRLFRFRLKLILIVLTLVAVSLGYRQARIRYYQGQKNLAESLLKHQIYFEYARAEPAWLTALCGGDCFEVTRMKCLAPGAKVDWSFLQKFPFLYRAKIISHTGSMIPDQLVDQLSECKQLTHLQIEHARITNEQFARLTTLMKLRSLQVAQWPLHRVNKKVSRVLDEGILETISKYEDLEELRLAVPFGNRNLHLCNRLRNLRKLDVQQTGITIEGLKQLDRLRDIQFPGLNQVIRRSRPENLKHLPWLTELSWHRPLTPDILPSLPRLKHLHIGSQRLSADNMRQIADHPKLTRLEFTGCGFKTGSLKHLSQMKNLEWLDLQRCHSIQGWAEHLVDLEKLAEIRHRRRRYRRRPFEARDEPLPEIVNLSKITNLKRLQIDFEFMTAADFAELARAPKLEQLNVRYSTIAGNVLDEVPNFESLAVLVLNPRIQSPRNTQKAGLGEYLIARGNLATVCPDLYFEDGFGAPIGKRPDWYK